MRHEDEPTELEDLLIEAGNRIKRSMLWDVRKVFEDLLTYEVHCALIPPDNKLSWGSFYDIVKKACIKNDWPRAGVTLVKILEKRMLLENTQKNFMTKDALALFYIFQNKDLKRVSKFIIDNYDFRFSTCHMWRNIYDFGKEYFKDTYTHLGMQGIIAFFSERIAREKEARNILSRSEMPVYYYLENASLNMVVQFFEKNFSIELQKIPNISWEDLISCLETCEVKNFSSPTFLQTVLMKRADNEKTHSQNQCFSECLQPLQELVAQEALSDAIVPPKEMLQAIDSWDILLNFIKNFEPELKDNIISKIPRLYFPQKSNRDTTTLYEAVIERHRLCKTRVTEKSIVWKTCSVCWRPVPMRYKGNAEKIYCQYHNSTCREKVPSHKRAKALAKKITESVGVYWNFQALSQKLYVFTSEAIPYREIFLDNVLLIWEESPCEALQNLPCEITWPRKEVLFAILPELGAVLKNEQGRYPDFILEQLTPIHPNLAEDEHQQMQALQTIWKKNFYFYVPELVKAELWLQRCRDIHNEILFPA